MRAHQNAIILNDRFAQKAGNNRKPISITNTAISLAEMSIAVYCVVVAACVESKRI